VCPSQVDCGIGSGCSVGGGDGGLWGRDSSGRSGAWVAAEGGWVDSSSPRRGCTRTHPEFLHVRKALRRFFARLSVLVALSTRFDRGVSAHRGLGSSSAS
jgi:hypothetical protein